MRFSNFLKRLKEIFNIFLYDYQAGVKATFRIATFLAAFIALSLLVYYHGYPLNAELQISIIGWIKGLFSIFIANYFIRLFFSFKRLSFIKKHWFEGIIILFLVADIGSFYLFHYPLLKITFLELGIANFDDIYMLFVQLYMLILIGIESLKLSQLILNIRIKPATFFIYSFIAIILFGTVLLMLPEMTHAASPISLLDALFTSVSATCVTGLIVVDTATIFTFKGWVIILMLMQIGGIGIISFAVFFASFMQKGLGIKHHAMVQDFLLEANLSNTLKLLKEIIFYTLFIELVGGILLYVLWAPELNFDSTNTKIFYSVFHSISAFCNAGFTLFTDGLLHELLRSSYILHMVIAVLIILGSIGFPVLKDLFSIKSLRTRMRQPWRKWTTSTQIAVYASLALIVSGAIIFLLLENQNVLVGQNWFEKMVSSFFQSVTRTAGFSTVNIGDLAIPTLLMLMFLMFIGASSGSTGGGIKTSTFVVIMLSVRDIIRGRKQIVFGRKSISTDLIYRALSILVFALLYSMFAIFLLSIAEPGMGIMQVSFEVISAFGTVGLSTGITPELSVAGKLIIIFSMFIGRVGILTLAFALSSPVHSTSYKYPQTELMIG